MSFPMLLSVSPFQAPSSTLLFSPSQMQDTSAPAASPPPIQGVPERREQHATPLCVWHLNMTGEGTFQGVELQPTAPEPSLGWSSSTETQNLQQPNLSFQDTPVTRDSHLLLTQFPDDLTRATPQSKSTPIFSVRGADPCQTQRDNLVPLPLTPLPSSTVSNTFNRKNRGTAGQVLLPGDARVLTPWSSPNT